MHLLFSPTHCVASDLGPVWPILFTLYTIVYQLQFLLLFFLNYKFLS